MIKFILIKNIVLIENLKINFDKGLSVFQEKQEQVTILLQV